MDAKVNLPVTEKVKLAVRDLDFYYGGFHALKRINMDIPEKKVTAFIGPSGCGKSTLLRTFNRMFELYPEQRAEGQILLDGQNILNAKDDVSLLRAKVGMVFQKPTPFPMSIYDNIAFGVKLFESLPRGRDGRARRVGAEEVGVVERGQGQAQPERPRACRAGSSSAFASRAASPSSPRCCCSTSPARRSTPFPPGRSKS